MNLSTYQTKAVATAIYSDSDQVVYPLLGLTNEAGEVAGKFKKYLRDADPDLVDVEVYWEHCKQEMAAELGDVLWYVANLANDLGFDLDAIAKGNIAKLQSRAERGVLGGSGDNR